MQTITPATTLEPTRNPRTVLENARNSWTDWLPGDGTAYRVHVLPITGGPDHADRILLINCCGRTLAVQYADPQVAAYRVQRWTRTRWRREGLHLTTGSHDWWPLVAQPLLAVAGVA